MPTSEQEARKILEISQDYITVGELKELFTRLDNDVGKISDNDSVKKSFEMFREFAEKAEAALTNEKNRVYLTIGWFLIWSFHSLMILGNMASFCVAPFLAPWYLAFPACFAIIWVVCSPVDCAITRWENKIRRKLGWPEIKYFISYYYTKPVKRAIKRRFGRRSSCEEKSWVGL